MNRVSEVNQALRAGGIADRLVRGRGYYYFVGPNADCWYSQSVMVYRASDLSVERWLAEYRDLRDNPLNR